MRTQNKGWSASSFFSSCRNPFFRLAQNKGWSASSFFSSCRNPFFRLARNNGRSPSPFLSSCRNPFFRLARNKGQATIEVAFVTLFFIVIVFALTDMSRICYNWMALQYAVNEGARFGSLGQTTEGIDTREESIVNQVESVAFNLGLEGVSVTLEDDQGGTTAGDAATFFTLRASKVLNLNLMSSSLLALVGNYDKQITLNARTLIRNEPFQA